VLIFIAATIDGANQMLRRESGRRRDSIQMHCLPSLFLFAANALEVPERIRTRSRLFESPRALCSNRGFIQLEIKTGFI